MNSSVFIPFTEKELVPQEERLEVIKKGGIMTIGVPKESSLNENRVPITPDAVQVLTQYGYKLMIESDAGKKAFFSDLEYSEAGAFIVDKAKAFEQDLVLKVSAPSLEEIELLKPNSYIISALQINLREKEYFKKLSEKKINAIAYEFIEDENKEQMLVKLIGEIAGGMSVLCASEMLAVSKGLMLGGITGVRPVEVVVLGADIVGEYAVRAAIGLGATVRVFDNSLSKLRNIQNSIGSRISTSMIDPKELTKSLRRADVLIGTIPRINMPPIVTEKMVTLMKQGSVIVDLTIDTGKCVETTEVTDFKKPYVEKHGVLHSGLPNLTSKIPRTTSKAISNFFLSYLLKINEEGGLENVLKLGNDCRQGFYMYKGRHTKQLVCDKFGLKFNDINLLLL